MYELVLRTDRVSHSTWSPDVDNVTDASAVRLQRLLHKFHIASINREVGQLSDWSTAAALKKAAVRIAIPAHTTIVYEGAPARSYFLIESGEVLAHRKHGRQVRSMVRRLSDGDVFGFDFAGTVGATCEAITHTVALSLDLRKLRELQRGSALVRRIMAAVHTSELELVMAGLGVQQPLHPTANPLPSTEVQPQCVAALRAVKACHADENAISDFPMEWRKFGS